MARPRRFELDELVLRPGTYFNPDTEVLIVVDDSPELDQASFDAEEQSDGGDWVLVSDELPLDEATRDELLERFQVRYRSAAPGPELGDEDDEVPLDPDADLDEDDELEPDEDVEELD
ncbi:MAG TPA: hypothetical protein VE972_09155 [Conexibacter sp.]|nr:hypothetical protein [Conexibacter sp.]